MKEFSSPQAPFSPDGIFSRTASLIGEAGLRRLSLSSVAVFGIGGVGGHVAETLVRCGVGKLTIVDNDTVSASNLNRQIVATVNTVGTLKVEAMKERLLSINPALHLTVCPVFVTPDNVDGFDFSSYDFIVDAIDCVSAKIALICRARTAGTPIISSMGTGNKLDPTALKITDIYQTSVCPLARVMRRELRRRNIDALTVLSSEETPRTPLSPTDEAQKEGKRAPASIAFVPATAGLLIAAHVVNALLAE